MASPPLATRPLSHHGDGSQPQAEAAVQDSGRRPSPGRVGLAACPIQGLRPRAAQRPRRGAGAASSPRGTHPRVPMPAPHSRTRFIHRRGQPARTHIRSKRPKRPRVRQCRARAPSESEPFLGLAPPPGSAFWHSTPPQGGRSQGTGRNAGVGAHRQRGSTALHSLQALLAT